jgi:hypothetical protein
MKSEFPAWRAFLPFVLAVVFSILALVFAPSSASALSAPVIDPQSASIALFGGTATIYTNSPSCSNQSGITANVYSNAYISPDLSTCNYGVSHIRVATTAPNVNLLNQRQVYKMNFTVTMLGPQLTSSMYVCGDIILANAGTDQQVKIFEQNVTTSISDTSSSGSDPITCQYSIDAARTTGDNWTTTGIDIFVDLPSAQFYLFQRPTLTGFNYLTAPADATNQQIVDALSVAQVQQHSDAQAQLQATQQQNAIAQQGNDQAQDRWEQEQQEQQDRENQAASDAQGGAGLFNFNVLNPLASLVGQDGCASIPTIAGWFNMTNTQVCSPYPTSVRQAVTPVVGLFLSILMFTFCWRLLGSDPSTMEHV